MSFIHGYLLAGLVLVAVPFLLHLLLQQKPKIMPFPAFRFLKQKRQSNRRKIQLQHWLLLLLRMLLLAALLFGLARPRLAGNLIPQSWRSALGSKIDRPVVALFVLDTSWSMDYRVDKKSRLEMAKTLAIRAFQQLPDTSRVAILETGEEVSDLDWIVSVSSLRIRLNQIQLRPVVTPIPRLIEQAYKLLIQESKAEENPLPLLYIFSDRTESSWINAEHLDLPIQQETINPVHINYLDFGMDNPADVSIDKITVEPQTASPGQTIHVAVEVRSTGMEFHDQVVCIWNPNGDEPLQQKLDLQPGQSKLVSFEFKAPIIPQEGRQSHFLPLTVTLRQDKNRLFEDGLPSNNQAFATIAIRKSGEFATRKLLILADNPGDCFIWVTAIEARARVAPSESFVVEVKTLQEADQMKPDDLKKYKVISLFETVAPSRQVWNLLEQYVNDGGSLCVVPAGQELEEQTVRQAFNEHGKLLLPGSLQGLRTIPASRDTGIAWAGFNSNHPLLLPFQEWSHNADLDFTQSQLKPFANRYWLIKPNPDGQVIMTYADKEGSPALLEKSLGLGRVFLFSVVQDNRRYDAEGKDIRRELNPSRKSLPGDRDWTNYWKDSSFGYLLTLKTLSYLAGDGPMESRNYFPGQDISVALPLETPAGAVFHLEGGPDLDLSESERNLRANREGTEGASLTVPAIAIPGNYRILNGQQTVISAFSINNRPEESQLNRISPSIMEAVLGPGSVVVPGPNFEPADSLNGNQPSPVELLPLFMILLVLVLTFEGTLANWFSRGRTGTDSVPARGSVP